MKVIISTDNHIGFMERDPVRGNDSFAAFEEVLATARRKRVDMVLLAGDLFHENKPTRYTMWRSVRTQCCLYRLGAPPVAVRWLQRYGCPRDWQHAGVYANDPQNKFSMPRLRNFLVILNPVSSGIRGSLLLNVYCRTMEIMRKYVMGYDPVRIQILSDYNASRVLGAGGSAASASASAAGAAAAAGQHRPSQQGAGAGAGRKRARNNDAEDGVDVGEVRRARVGRDGAPSSSSSSAAAAAAAGEGQEDRAGTGAAAAPPDGVLGHGGLFHRVNFEDPNYNIDLPVFRYACMYCCCR